MAKRIDFNRIDKRRRFPLGTIARDENGQKRIYVKWLKSGESEDISCNKPLRLIQPQIPSG